MARKQPTTRRRSKEKLDPFTAEIMRSYLLSTVRAMIETTTRTAYSTCFSEGLDFTCGLFDVKGRMVAQALGIPVHSGALEDALATVMNSYDGFEEGDVVVHNDPYNGGSHQADVGIIRPMFVHGELLGFAFNRGHWTDVGSMNPGGWSGTASDVIQEGLLIPPVKLYKAGVLDREIRDLILKNVRMAKQCWGDLQSQIASNIVAERQMAELVDKYGWDLTLQGMDETISYSRRRFAALLERLPDGTWNGTEVFEDDGHGGGPHYIRVEVTKKGHGVTVDFSGSDPQVRGPINCCYALTKAAAYTAVVATVDPQVPFNAGVLELIRVTAPEGSINRPVYPAPVFCSTADPGDKTFEAVLKAVGQMAPARTAAGSYCTGNNMTTAGIDPETGEEILWYLYESGGCGARPNKDGNSAEWHPMGNCKTESMEIWEARYPVRFEQYGLVTDSAGAGRFRGGLGVKRHLRQLVDTTVSACADRHRIPPWGLDSGKEGTPNSFSLIRDGEEWDFPSLFNTRSPAKFSLIPLKTGDIVSVSQGGGGGYGDPLERDPKQVEWDVLNGYVSPEGAREEYGVWVDPETGVADPGKTRELRSGAPLA